MLEFTDEIKQRIFNAIDQAIKEVTGTDGKSLCELTCLVARDLLNSLSSGWEGRAGHFVDPVTREKFHGERNGYHCWVQRDTDAGTEVADFRAYRWIHVDHPPAYVWELASDLEERGIIFDADERFDPVIRRMVAIDGTLECVRRARSLFHGAAPLTRQDRKAITRLGVFSVGESWGWQVGGNGIAMAPLLAP